MNSFTFYNLKLIKDNTVKYEFESDRVRTPREGYDILKNVVEMESLSEEYLYMIALGTKNNVLGIFEVHHGTLNSSLVHPREVFKRACMINAASIIVAHNHPSGDPTPSKDDIDITKRLVEGGKILGIDVLDHIIVGDNTYTSFKEKCLI